SNTEKEILKLIKNMPTITQNELGKEINLTPRTIRRNIDNLKVKGIIERVGSDKKGYWKIN
ncbi:MAG: winged helix-turn-helix transcriptional regulator, partial [Clostridia bacterium]